MLTKRDDFFNKYTIDIFENVEIKDQKKLNTKLEQLIKNKILTRYYFSSNIGEGIFRVYALEKMGKYLLNSREIECKWQPSDNAKPVEMLKKKLAGNQLVIIAYLKKVKVFDNYVVKPALTAKTMNKVFKPSGGLVTLTKSNKSIQFLFEVIRRENEWQKKCVDKMRFYKDFYDNFVPGDSGFLTIPQLVFICEDNKHSAEIFKTLILNNIKIDKINFLYTTDLQQNEDNLKKSLYEFVEEDGKYKIKNVEAKILS